MGSTIVTIGLPYFKKLKLAAPVSIDEQNEIGRRLKTIDSYIQSHKADSEKLKQQKSGLMHDLLTGKVQVPINSTEAVYV
jgi:type I restriction enzyme S subunit